VKSGGKELKDPVVNFAILGAARQTQAIAWRLPGQAFTPALVLALQNPIVCRRFSKAIAWRIPLMIAWPGFFAIAWR
jgi:hypothetical protein